MTSSTTYFVRRLTEPTDIRFRPGLPEVKLRSVASPQKAAAPAVSVLATTQSAAVDDVPPQDQVGQPNALADSVLSDASGNEQP
jgi:hypothetical protein